ncbi:1-phosphatidylinositol-3-phosphate 5-kinase [Boothiomyces macroporosus]|uniref:1-phosphatidylinositol-3-phosphate 5-kinase n=1 Tax=Boothiomyces macroporosus TaxID=261099 RepID=A0AAD5UHU2_9FUNG|nr:1-phosphatidylinositol-3-phosphate 5-kinase [Boothiomyces macroporosus]
METKIPKIKPKKPDSAESMQRSMIPTFQDKRNLYAKKSRNLSAVNSESTITEGSSSQSLVTSNTQNTTASRNITHIQDITDSQNITHIQGITDSQNISCSTNDQTLNRGQTPSRDEIIDKELNKPLVKKKLRHSVSMPIMKPQSNPAVSFSNMYKIMEIEFIIKIPLVSNTRIFIRQDKINSNQTLFLFNDLIIIHPPTTLIPTSKLLIEYKDGVELNGIPVEFDDFKNENDFIGTVSILKNRWMKDYESENCLVCKKKFNLFFRRHHCRGCGRLICSKCSVFNDSIRNCKDCAE